MKQLTYQEIQKRFETWKTKPDFIGKLPSGFSLILDKFRDTPIRGLSAFDFGIEWERPKSQKSIAKNLLSFLSYRRIFSVSIQWERVKDVRESSIKIRDFLQKHEENITHELLEGCFDAMRVACDNFQTLLEEPPIPREKSWKALDKLDKIRFVDAMTELRYNFGIYSAYIAATYKINIKGSLIDVIPPAEVLKQESFVE